MEWQSDWQSEIGPAPPELGSGFAIFWVKKDIIIISATSCSHKISVDTTGVMS